MVQKTRLKKKPLIALYNVLTAPNKQNQTLWTPSSWAVLIYRSRRSILIVTSYLLHRKMPTTPNKKLTIFLLLPRNIKANVNIRCGNILLLAGKGTHQTFLCAHWLILQFQTRDQFYLILKNVTIFIYSMLFFWVIPLRLNFICRRFGTLCLFHHHRRIGMKDPPMKMEQSVSKRRHIKFRRRRITQKKSIQHSEHGESLK